MYLNQFLKIRRKCAATPFLRNDDLIRPSNISLADPGFRIGDGKNPDLGSEIEDPQ